MRVRAVVFHRLDIKGTVSQDFRPLFDKKKNSIRAPNERAKQILEHLRFHEKIRMPA